MPRFAALALVLATTTTAAAAPCPSLGMEPKVLSRTGVALPADGGIVVASVTSRDHPHAFGDVTTQPDWRFRIARSTVAPAAIDTLAPGLVVYRVPAGTGAVELLDGKAAVLATRDRAMKIPAALAAPKLKRVAYQASRAGRRSTSSVTAELEGAAPAGAIALVVADEKGTPKSWGSLEDGKTVWLHSSGGCGVQAPGTRVSTPGEHVVLYWIDATGRRGASTPVLTVVDRS